MAYEISKLAEKLKGQGLSLAEEAAKDVAVAVLDWVAEEAVASENKIDDLVVPFVPMIKARALEAISHIDGK